MGQITGGTVVFARSVQPAQYETKKAEVTLTFVLAEGEDMGTFLDHVGATAQAKALEMVGLKQAVATQPATAQTVSPGPAPAKEEGPKTPRTPRKPKETSENKAALILETATTPADIAKAKAVLDDLGDAGKPQISTNPENRVAPGEKVQDEFADLEGPKEITDEQLDKIGHAFVSGGIPGAGKKIRDLRDKYTGQPGQPLRTLAKEKRQAFVDELATLT